MKNRIDASADGLRGLAALIVVLCHFGGAFAPAAFLSLYPTVFGVTPSVGWETLLSYFPLSLLINGHLAVLVFFVLSGYVLTKPAWESGDKETILRRLLGRYFRLNIPLAASIIIAYALVVMGLYFNSDVPNIVLGNEIFATFYSGGIAITDVIYQASFGAILLGDGGLIPPSWTISIEFIGSILILAFYLLKPRTKSVAPELLAIIAVYFLFPENNYFYICFFMGALLNRVNLPYYLSWLALLAGIYFGSYAYGSLLYMWLPGGETADMYMVSRNRYLAIGAVLIVVAVKSGCLRSFFGAVLMRKLGEISFSMYLLHFPILCSAASGVFVTLGGTALAYIVTFVTLVGGTIAASLVFNRLVDKPAVAISHRFSRKLMALLNNFSPFRKLITSKQFARPRLSEKIGGHLNEQRP